jgi:two-component system, OmpR family, sensor histidine kinase CiaH
MVKQKKFALVTIGYWFLLLYAVFALFFWFLSLNNQNNNLAQLKITELSITSPKNYQEQLQTILDYKKRKETQYLAEGLTFFVVLIIGAWFVYQSIRKQIKLTQQQQNFLMAVTHELKTPIAVTQLNLETLQKRSLDPTQQQKIINNTLQEANRLNGLCNNILLSSQIDSDSFKSNKQLINFGTIVKTSCESFKKRFTTKNIDVHIDENCYLKGEPFLLEMLVNNLVDNAIKYSANQPNIFVSLSSNNKSIVLQVKDEGIGVDENQKNKLFTKFYRIENEATRTTKGTGLGLYLCKKISNHHNGNITVTKNKPKGSIFEVQFNT